MPRARRGSDSSTTSEAAANTPTVPQEPLPQTIESRTAQGLHPDIKFALWTRKGREAWDNWWATTKWRQRHPNTTINWDKEKGKSSPHWNLFDPVARVKDGKPKAQCMRCLQIVAHPYNGNGLSHFPKHQKSETCRVRAEASGKGPLTPFLSRSAIKHQEAQRATNKDFHDYEYDLQTLRVVAALRLPFHALDHDELLRWVYTIRNAPPSWQPRVLASKAVRPLMQQQVPLRQKEIMSRLPAKAKMSIAIDCWTSPNHHSFLAITGYFIDNQWKFCEILVEFAHVTADHTGGSLARLILEALERAGIELSQLLCITADNARNNATTVKALKEAITNATEIIQYQYLEKSNVMPDPCRMIRNPCLAHVIQLSLKALIEDIKIQARNNKVITEWHEDPARREEHSEHGDIGAPATLKKLRSIVIKINASTQRRRKFHSHQNRTRPLNLLQDVATRWNSTLHMLRRARLLRPELKKYFDKKPLKEDKDKLCTLTPEEWRHVDYLIDILHPFELFTTGISKSQGPTIHLVFEIYNKLITHMDEQIERLEKKKVAWKRKMKQALENGRTKLKEYYGQTTGVLGQIYSAATILCPSLKLDYFKGEEWQDVDEETGELWTTVYRKSFEELFKYYEHVHGTAAPPPPRPTSLHRDASTMSQASAASVSNLDSSPAPRSTTSTTTPQPSTTKRKREADDIHDLVARGSKRMKQTTSIRSDEEFEQYLRDQLNFNIDDNLHKRILEFWSLAEKRWPILAAMARDFLSIPASGVGVERLFNIARDVCTYRRHHLLPATIRDLMFMICMDAFDLKECYRIAHDLEKMKLAQLEVVKSEEEEDCADEEGEDKDPYLISDGEDGEIKDDDVGSDVDARADDGIVIYSDDGAYHRDRNDEGDGGDDSDDGAGAGSEESEEAEDDVVALRSQRSQTRRRVEDFVDGLDPRAAGADDDDSLLPPSPPKPPLPKGVAFLQKRSNELKKAAATAQSKGSSSKTTPTRQADQSRLNLKGQGRGGEQRLLRGRGRPGGEEHHGKGKGKAV